MRKEGGGNELDVDINFKPKIGIQVEISDLAFKFSAKGSESGDNYKIEGTVTSLKAILAGEKEQLTNNIVIPSFSIRDVHIEVDNFLSITKADKLLHLEH